MYWVFGIVQVTTSTNMFRYRLHVYNEGLWCRGKYQLDSNMTGYYERFLRQIGIGEADPGQCSVPCKVKRYQVMDIGLKEHIDTWIEIWFEKKVEITKSEFSVNMESLLSTIGGFIGISKNFLWLLIMLITSVGTFVTRFNASNIIC